VHVAPILPAYQNSKFRRIISRIFISAKSFPKIEKNLFGLRQEILSVSLQRRASMSFKTWAAAQDNKPQVAPQPAPATERIAPPTTPAEPFPQPKLAPGESPPTDEPKST
jgi:hypothetical protein